MTRLGRVAVMLLVTGLATAQTTTTTTNSKARHKTKAPAARSVTAEDLDALKTQMQQQQEEINRLKGQLSDRDQQLSTATQTNSSAQQAAADAAAKADAAQQNSQAAQEKVDSLKSTVDNMKVTSDGLQQTILEGQQRVTDAIESPTALHYKGVSITPVAFFAFEGVWRQRSVNSDINTPFNSIPLPGANEGHVSELNFSGRQSRLGLRVVGDAGPYRLTGYFEGDFLSSGTTSNNNQSNSYTFRQRQFWGQAATAGGFTVTGGQTWSLVTETGKSTDAGTEKLPNTIDPQYMVGFSWTRQPGVRFQKRWGDSNIHAFTAAFSFEQAQILNLSVQGTAPAAEFYQGNGQGGGLYNAYSGQYANNVAPDMVVKGTYDLPHAHFELGGLVRFFRTVYNPLTSGNSSTYTYDTTQQLKNTKTGGGGFVGVRVSPSKFIDVAVQGMFGDGVARYGSSTLPDVTVKSDGTLEPLRHYHGMLSLETHPTKKLDVFGYYGGEYDQRTVYQVGSNIFGYGPTNAADGGCYSLAPITSTAYNGGSLSPANCASPTRYIQEGMFGWTYRFVNSPKYGRLQYSMTWQYMQRNLWSGQVTTGTPVVAGAPTGPRAVDNMIHIGMRYYIP